LSASDRGARRKPQHVRLKADATNQRGSTASPRRASSVDPLIAAARQVRRNAHATYSGFKVGAALETQDGAIITGCNVENATYGLTICAERVALFKAISEGHRHFRRVAVVADTDDPTPPCGACRQLLWEFGGDLEVLLASLRRQTARLQLKDLLPLPFDGRLLK
jgi:cytidine deaminase